MKKIFILICCLSLVFSSCEDDIRLNPDGFIEFNVDINGSWIIDNVTQNGLDITNRLNFQSFSLDLNYDGVNPSTFSIPHTSIPFGIDFSSGSWTFDDLTYPTKLNFTDGGGNMVEVSLAEIPLLSKGNSLKVQFQLGCADNTYVYSFKKN
ncbi:DUF5004 domain-containing protein [Changchengzhania lutea]|uniref:DUF5004 domain-containing protein n=1 Tax=Changchengzhania lutea TaxID=2049305 RepID=UPI00115DE9D8|nr:DUF5004 domain-containing protein [Changchengzhania lutea]